MLYTEGQQAQQLGCVGRFQLRAIEEIDISSE